MPAMLLQRLAGVGVHVEAREIAAADVHANAVAFLEDIARRIQPHRERINLAGFHELLFLQRIPETRATNAIGDVHVEATWPVGARWINVDELRGEVGIDGTR